MWFRTVSESKTDLTLVLRETLQRTGTGLGKPLEELRQRSINAIKIASLTV